MSIIQATSGSVDFKYNVNGTPIGDFENDTLTSSGTVTVLSTAIVTNDPDPSPNPVETSSFGTTPTYVEGTVVITFKNSTSFESAEVKVTLTQFANTAFTITGYTIEGSAEVTTDLTTEFSMGTLASNTTKTLAIKVKYTGTTAGDTGTLLIAAVEGTNDITVGTITAEAVFAILSGTINVVDSNNTTITTPVVANGQTVSYLISLENSGNVATTITKPLITLDTTGFTLTSVYGGATTAGLTQLDAADYSLNAALLTINPGTPVVIAANDGTNNGLYFFKVNGTAVYVV